MAVEDVALSTYVDLYDRIEALENELAEARRWARIATAALAEISGVVASLPVE